jgi:hypothetical protein
VLVLVLVVVVVGCAFMVFSLVLAGVR